MGIDKLLQASVNNYGQSVPTRATFVGASADAEALLDADSVILHIPANLH